ncbi:hypothetical protein D3C83_227210 [compost metagenome]
MRFETRKMCVSTAIVGSAKAMFITTFAVLRPTPGSVTSVSRSRGTSLPCRSTSSRLISITFLAFALNRPIVRM